MINETFELCRRTVAVRGEENADFLLIQPMGDFEMKSFGTEYEHIKKCGRCIFAAFIIDNWNDELSPWQAKPVWGNEVFGGKAEDTLSFVTTELIPKLKEKYRLDDTVKIVIGGYSLAALFSLWAVYKCDVFYGAAAASPSVWFPNWIDFISQVHPHAEKIYLSLGKKEIASLLEEGEPIEVNCQFCNKNYKVDLNELLKKWPASDEKQGLEKT